MNYRIMSRSTSAVILGLAILGAARAQAVVIRFDGFGNGAAVTSQHLVDGVLFSSNGGQAAHAMADPAEATSAPNILVGADNFSDIFVRFVDPATGVPSPNALAMCASLKLISVGLAEITVTSRSLSGSPLESFVYTHPSGPANGYQCVDPVAFNLAGVAGIDIVFTRQGPPGVDGVGIDDLEYSFLESCNPVPAESTTWGSLKALHR
jgi:hypothetical protein